MTPQNRAQTLEETTEYQQLEKEFRQDIENMTYAFMLRKTHRTEQFNRDKELLRRILKFTKVNTS